MRKGLPRMGAALLAACLLLPGTGLAQEEAADGFDPVWPTEDYYTLKVAYVISLDRREDGELHGDGHALDIGFLGQNTRQEVYAIESGEARAVSTDRSKGNYVEIRHGDGYVSTYLHLSSFVIPETTKKDETPVWTPVQKGDLIGYMGRTGNAEGSHLHLELRQDGDWADILPFYFVKYSKDMVITEKTGVKQSKYYDEYIDGTFTLDKDEGAWVFAGYRIRLDLAGAKAARPEPVLAQPGQEITLPMVSSYGKSFLGWATEKKGDVVYKCDTPYLFDRAMTLYAVWES